MFNGKNHTSMPVQIVNIYLHDELSQQALVDEIRSWKLEFILFGCLTCVLDHSRNFKAWKINLFKKSFGVNWKNYFLFAATGTWKFPSNISRFESFTTILEKLKEETRKLQREEEKKICDNILSSLLNVTLARCKTRSLNNNKRNLINVSAFARRRVSDFSLQLDVQLISCCLAHQFHLGHSKSFLCIELLSFSVWSDKVNCAISR